MREIKKKGSDLSTDHDFRNCLSEINKFGKYNDTLIKEWISTKQVEGCSKETIRSYESFIRGFAYIMDKKLTDVTTAEIRHFLLEYQEKREVSNKTIDGMRRYLSSFYNFLEEEYYISTSPARRVHKIKSVSSVKKPFSDDETILLEYACKTARDRAMIGFLLSTGVRVSELSRLDINDIDMRNREAIVYGKGAKERVVYFDARAKVFLERYLASRTDDNPALFVIDRNPFNRMEKPGIEWVVREIGREAGVTNCHPHRFRRTFATKMLNRGMPIEQVQKLLGHARIETTLIYTEISQENVRVSYNKHYS